MSDAIERFFADLTVRDQDPALGRVLGTVRFDVGDHGRTRHWLVRLNHGDITVREEDGAADGVLRVERQVFEQMVEGRMNILAAVLRGAAAMDGDAELLVYAVRLFAPPNPASGGRPVVTTSGGSQ